MRKLVSAIFLFIVFFSLQFGKVVTYMYCKWKTELIENKTDCGCDTHLASMFGSADNSQTITSLPASEVPVEYFGHSFASGLKTPFIIINNSFAAYNCITCSHWPPVLEQPPAHFS